MIRSATNTAECRELWERLSPGQDAWDDWDLIFAFHDEEKHCFNFLVHQTDTGRPDGLVPLVHDTSLGRYTLMGGSYPDGRTLWIRREDFPAFFEAIPEPTVFFDLRKSFVDGLLQVHPQYAAHFGELETRYYLVPSAFDYDFHNHLDLFSSEKKQKFLYDLRKIRKLEPTLRWSDDNETELFIKLVNCNFGDESDYVDDGNANELRRVIAELQQSGRLKTLTIEIGGEKQAVSLSLMHGNKMIALYAASNNDFNNLGKLLNVETIQEGCRLRVDEISYMTGMQWKANWQMNSEPCVTMRKPRAPWSTTSA
jgi:hypothetical protein